MDFVWLMVALVVIVIAVSIAFGILAKVRMARSLAARGVHVTKAFWRINLKKIFRPSSLIFAIVFIFFLIYATMLLFPVIWGFLSSLKSGGIRGEYFHNMFGLPTEWKFSNYVQAFETMRYFLCRDVLEQYMVCARFGVDHDGIYCCFCLCFE